MDEPVRVDKWLWAARLVRTRSLGADAVRGGRVHVNDRSVKPSRDIHVGDVVQITLGFARRTVVVRGISDRRGPAPVAEQLYEETAESVAAREAAAAERRLAQPSWPQPGGRPTKRDRRRYEDTRRRADER